MIKNVIFDYGNVLVDWNPAYLFMPVLSADTLQTMSATVNGSPAWTGARIWTHA